MRTDAPFQLYKRGLTWLVLLLISLSISACSSLPKQSEDKYSSKSSKSSTATSPSKTSQKSAASNKASTANPPKVMKNGGGFYQDDGVGEHPVGVDLDTIPDAVPQLEKNLKKSQAYSVMGQQYQPLTGTQAYKETGVASWYGKKFHGQKTANGEKYNMYTMSAAHKTLPLPSYARVTNIENGKSVVVRVNDRGPFIQNRLIDLSYAAAHRLGFTGSGTGKVEVESIDPESLKIPVAVVTTRTSAAALAPEDFAKQGDLALVKDGAQPSSAPLNRTKEQLEPPAIAEQTSKPVVESAASTINNQQTNNIYLAAPAKIAEIKVKAGKYIQPRVSEDESTAEKASQDTLPVNSPPLPKVAALNISAPKLETINIPTPNPVIAEQINEGKIVSQTNADNNVQAKASDDKIKYYLQFGAFLKSNNAEKLQQELQATAGEYKFNLLKLTNDEKQLQRVVTGPFANYAQAVQEQQKLLQHSPLIIKSE